jgi:hypothetical protein
MRYAAAIVALALAGCAKHIPIPTPTTGSGRNVVIAWTASTTPNVTYNVYRLANPCAGTGTAVKLTATPITALTYTDPDVPIGTFCYWATSWLQAASVQESGPSNKQEVTIIQQPNPPTNLQITPPAVTMQVGSSQQFTANIPDATWSVDPPDMGSIDSTGYYTAPASIKGNNIQVQVLARSGAQTAVAQVTIRKN